MGKVKNQEQGSTSSVTMDARTLLRTINTGALSQHKIFEDKIRAIGEENGRVYSLTTLNPNSLIFEDVESGLYYKADIHRLKGGNIKIDNITSLKIVEGQKKVSFDKACYDLVAAIAEEDQRGAESAFSKIGRQHFRPNVVPSSGWVKTRDGVNRYVGVQEDIVSPEMKPFVVRGICEALSDRVIISKGQIVEAIFSDSDERLKIPITELTRRRVVARHMKEAAQKAYLSEGFRKRVTAAAGHFSNGNIREAAKIFVPFLSENQEFSLLTFTESKQLATDGLAAIGCFNDKLSEDLGKLIYKTSCKVNRKDILESWKKTAQRSESATLVQNTRILHERKDFEDAYSEFLQMVFVEDSSTKSVRAQSYLNALKEIRKVVEGNNEEGILASLDDYIMRLESDPEEIDDATLYEIEDVLASISQELIQDVKSLSDYDELPEPPEAEMAEQFGEKDLSGEQGAAAAGGGAAVPLPMGDLGAEPEGEGETLDLGPELGGAEGGAGDLGAEMPLAADVNRVSKPISEMTVEQLVEELPKWAAGAERFCLEHGVDVFAKQIGHRIDRAIALENNELVESFEKVLSDNLLAEQGERDPYAFDEESMVTINDSYGNESATCNECGMEMSTQECMESGSRCGGCGADMTEALAMTGRPMSGRPAAPGAPRGTGHAARQASRERGSSLRRGEMGRGEAPKLGVPGMREASGEYGGTGTEMGGQDGKGVAGKGSSKSDGKSASGAAGSGKKDGSVSGTVSDSKLLERIEAAMSEATGEYGGTGLEMGGQDGKGVAGSGTKKVSGTDGSSSPGGSANKDEMDNQGGSGVAGSSAKSSDGKSGGTSAASGGGEVDDKDAGAGKAKTPKGYDGTGLEMGGQDGEGIAAKEPTSSDGTSSNKGNSGGTVGEDVEIEEGKLACGCTAGSCVSNSDCDCGSDCPCKQDTKNEDQYKTPTKRRRMNPRRASLMPTESVDKEMDDVISSIASSIVNDDDIVDEALADEGKLPPALEKWKKKKGGGKKGDDDSDSDSDGGDDDGDDDDGDDGGNPFGEDKDITTPEGSAYDSEALSRKDGDGKMRRPLPKFSDTDYDGSTGAKTADKSDAGHP